MGVGFEDVVPQEAGRVKELASRLDDVGARAVSLAVGRLDWLAYPRHGHEDAWTPRVRETRRDFVREAVDALGKGKGGKREVTLVIDALAPRLLAERPEFAGRSAAGESSDGFAGVAAWEGELGDDLAGLAGDVARRYRPARIGVTELLFDDATFSEADLASYRAANGRTDWPRTGEGSIDADDASLGRWRTRVIRGVLERVKRAVEPVGCGLDMDVRAAWDRPEVGRAESGHGYEELLTAADRLVVWNYFALVGKGPEAGTELTRALRESLGDRFVSSTGLWAQGDGVLSPETMVQALAGTVDAGAPEVSITPASLMSAAHWDALAAWVG